MLRRIIIALVLVLAPAAGTGAARADWRRSIDLNYGTAFTLEQGMVEIGVMTPLSIGVTDELQVALHPILLLLGQPYIALRWRASRYGVATVALNLAGSWSLIRREDEAGTPATEGTPGGGFPGTVQLTATLTFRAGHDWLFSVGAGPGIDLLGARPIRGLAELHASAHWLIDASQLVMLHATGYLDTPTSRAWSDEEREAALAATPLGRAGRPDDAASAAVWLASSAAAFVTGAVLRVDGGLAA